MYSSGNVLPRIIQVQLLARALDRRLTIGESLSVPILDLIQFGAQLVPFVSDEITWRGYRARLGANTLLLPVETREVSPRCQPLVE